ncbi:response regulator transcription factor [Bosea sp. AS-1]|uniref:response regulator transcription factor n=1 Tax=Bosea sp. AS-1 TaxID=2015316 RepID=UPI0018DFCED2|nr:response regulator transcription factor [Bosea sp. AS-1]
MKENRAFCVVILGKYSLMKEGISRVLQANDFRVLTSNSCSEQIKLRTRAPKTLFLIVHADDEFGDVVAEIELLREQYPEAYVAVVAEHYGPDEPALAFKAGAAGYLVNAISCDAFVKSIELLMLGESIFPPAFPAPAPAVKAQRRSKAATIASHEDEISAAYTSQEDTAAPLLSPRETAILRCLIEGDSNKFIARKIDITEATVKAHVKAILRKIRVQNRTQAAIWGMNNALLLLPANSNSLLTAASTENA